MWSRSLLGGGFPASSSLFGYYGREAGSSTGFFQIIMICYNVINVCIFLGTWCCLTVPASRLSRSRDFSKYSVSKNTFYQLKY